jgi:hypothetical protein
MELLKRFAATSCALAPQDSPHSGTAPNISTNTGCWASNSVKRSIRGRNLCSGMFGISWYLLARALTEPSRPLLARCIPEFPSTSNVLNMGFSSPIVANIFPFVMRRAEQRRAELVIMSPAPKRNRRYMGLNDEIYQRGRKIDRNLHCGQMGGCSYQINIAMRGAWSDQHETAGSEA